MNWSHTNTTSISKGPSSQTSSWATAKLVWQLLMLEVLKNIAVAAVLKEWVHPQIPGEERLHSLRKVPLTGVLHQTIF